jgi:hypothetical protein
MVPVDIIEEMDICESILKLGVVMIRNWTERVEKIWVNLASLGN